MVADGVEVEVESLWPLAIPSGRSALTMPVSSLVLDSRRTR